MIEWIDVAQIKKDLRRMRDSNNLKKFEEKMEKIEAKKKEINEKKQFVNFVSRYIIEPYHRSKFLPNIGNEIYIDKYTNEEENGDFMMGKAKDKYFIAYSQGYATKLIVFEKESKDLDNGTIVRSFNAHTVILGCFLNPSVNTVENYHIPSVICNDEKSCTYTNEDYYKLLDKAIRIDDRMKRYSSAIKR